MKTHGTQIDHALLKLIDAIPPKECRDLIDAVAEHRVSGLPEERTLPALLRNYIAGELTILPRGYDNN